MCVLSSVWSDGQMPETVGATTNRLVGNRENVCLDVMIYDAVTWWYNLNILNILNKFEWSMVHVKIGA